MVFPCKHICVTAETCLDFNGTVFATVGFEAVYGCSIMKIREVQQPSKGKKLTDSEYCQSVQDM